MTRAQQPPHHVATHPAQTNHSKLHRSPFSHSERSEESLFSCEGTSSKDQRCVSAQNALPQ
jgi:hypothetical protein